MAQPVETSLWKALWDKVTSDPGWPMVVIVAVLLSLVQVTGLYWYMHAADIPVRWDIALIIPLFVVIASNTLFLWVMERMLRGMYGPALRGVEQYKELAEWLHPRWIAAARWLEDNDKMIRPMQLQEDVAAVIDIPENRERPLDHEPPQILLTTRATTPLKQPR